MNDVLNLTGKLETIDNLSQIARFLIEAGKLEYLATVLELIYEEAQELAFQYAVKQDGN